MHSIRGNVSECTQVRLVNAACYVCKLMFQFHPPGGPIEGGTKLNVSGVNLGKAASDLQVSVAGVLCGVQDDSYVPSQRCVSYLSAFCHHF